MGKCVDEFEEVVNRVNRDIREGQLRKDGVYAIYLGTIAGYLADIADELHELNETNREALSNNIKAQEDLMTFNREMQNDLRRSRDESKN